MGTDENEGKSLSLTPTLAHKPYFPVEGETVSIDLVHDKRIR